MLTCSPTITMITGISTSTREFNLNFHRGEEMMYINCRSPFCIYICLEAIATYHLYLLGSLFIPQTLAFECHHGPLQLFRWHPRSRSIPPHERRVRFGLYAIRLGCWSPVSILPLGIN